jgi:F-type H+-transporting ATPase subunit b
MKAKLDATQQESAAIIKKAQLEGAKFIEEARKAAKDFSDREQKAATERANEIVAKAQQAIELEHKKMIADTRGEIARLVVAITQRVLARELSEADRTRYNDSAARELTNVQ